MVPGGGGSGKVKIAITREIFAIAGERFSVL